MSAIDNALLEFAKNINIAYSQTAIKDYFEHSFVIFPTAKETEQGISGMSAAISMLEIQQQVIEGFSPQIKFLQTANRYLNYIEKFSSVSDGYREFLNKWAVSNEYRAKMQKQYDFEKLMGILQDVTVYQTSAQFDTEAVTNAVTEEYVKDEPELSNTGSSLSEEDKNERIKGIRDWIGFWLTVIGFMISVYSLVSTKPSDTYNTAVEVNNYYVRDLEINAVMLNEMSYRIVREDGVMPRIKPDCSSRVTGHLRMGQIVMISGKYRKWVEINWEDEAGNYHSGWVQSYRLMEFR